MTTVKSPTYARSPPPQRLNIDRCINKKQKFTRTTSASRYYSFKSRNSKKFSTPKNSPFPLTQSIKVHRRALVLLTCLIPCHRFENPQENLATLTIFDHATWQHTSENPRHVRGIYDVRMAQFVLKIEKLSHSMGPRGSQDLWSPSPIMAPVIT